MATRKKTTRKKATRKKPGIHFNSKYKSEFAQRILDFFSIPAGTWEHVENAKGEVQVIRRANDLPLYESFARSIGVSHATLLNWTHASNPDGSLKYPEFAAAYKACKDDQTRILVENGLQGGYTPSFAIFTAKNILGWRDAQVHEHHNRGNRPAQAITDKMTPQEAAAAYAETLGNTGSNVVSIKQKKAR